MSRPVWPAGHYVSGLSVRHVLGVPLWVQRPAKTAFSTNYHACIAMPTWPRCAPPILCWPWPPYNLLPRSCLTWIFFVDPHWGVPLCLQRPAKTMPFQQIIMHALHYQHHVDVHFLFCFDLDLPITCCRGLVNLDFLRRSSLMGTTLRAVPSKSHAFSTNYHTCIAMPIWHRCAPPILFWPWPPYTLLPRSCFTWMFFVDPHWWVPLCVQCPAKAMHFKQIIMHALQCQHDVDVHLLFCFDIDLHLICSQVHV